MKLEQALQEAINISPIGKKITVKVLDEGFEAIQSIVFPYGYRFEICNLLAFTKDDLKREVQEHWGMVIPASYLK